MRTTRWIVVLGLVFVGCNDSPEQSESKSMAAYSEVSLPGSNFEIDTDANLVVDVVDQMDWGSVLDEDRRADEPSGSSDNSFGQGSKEDTPVPVVVSGSIPPNKSDLLNFGVYLEAAGANRFLHMFWHRVQEPSGTTNMDFEFNQLGTLSGNGVTYLRKSGDLLIQYDLAQGGTTPELFLSRWIDGTEGKTADDCEASNRLPCWSKKTDLTAAGDATGSINTSAIAAADADGLGDISPRTFGEASVDFSALVGEDECVSFGSAYLKSRSSDSFTAALKDFIAPVPVTISNCGTIKVVKVDDATPPALLSGAAFDLRKDNPDVGGSPGAEDPVVDSCVTAANGECSFTNVLQGHYWLVETSPPAGHDLAVPSYQAVEIAADAVETRTFVDPRQRGAIKVVKTRKHAAAGPGSHAQAGVSFTINGVTKQTDADGVACFDGLLFGTYAVEEAVPTGYLGEGTKNVDVDNKAACDDATYVGESVAFENTPLSDFTIVFSSQVPGGTAAKISCAELSPTPADATPFAFDDAIESYVSLTPGTYNCTIVIDP
jgi:hypothetical protein